VRDLVEMKGLKIRVPGAPIWSRAFAAVGMAPIVIPVNEINKATRDNVIEAGENDVAVIEAMKLYEAGSNLSLTEHAIAIRPICFSAKTFRALPADLQTAILKAGKEAGAYGRQIEPAADAARRDALEQAGKLKRILFADRAAMRKLAEPVIAAYAREIGAGEVYEQINAIK
jgi:TRAP-type C4-dicarboxylate transport system substrate-binding protein